jgi:hypothetical protein
MPDTAWTFGMAGEAPMLFGITSLARALTDFVPFWPGVRAALESAEAGIFAAEGPGWLPLKEPYASLKAAAHPDKSILMLTDAMHDSLTGTTSDTVYDPNPTYMRWGTRVGADEAEDGVSYAVRLDSGEGNNLAGPRPILPSDILANALEIAVSGVAVELAAAWAGGA